MGSDVQVKKLLSQLEDDLYHFIIKEKSKDNPEIRSSSEVYKYKGIALNLVTNKQRKETTVKVRIGVLEAEFKLDSCEKNDGALQPDDEYIVKLWLSSGDTCNRLKFIAKSLAKSEDKTIIIPFDLENLFRNI